MWSVSENPSYRDRSNEIPPRWNNVDAVSYAPGKGPVLKESHNRQETLKKCPDKYECMNLPKDMVDLLKEDDSLKKAGFRFDKASGKLIFPEGFGNTEKIRKIRKFLEFSGWLYSAKAEKFKDSNPEQYKTEKFKKSIELTRIDTNIEGMNKKILEYRYIISIYQDIMDDGFVFQKDENWNYKIYNPKTKEIAKWPYAKLLLDSRNISSFNLDFAFITAIVKDPRYSGVYSEKWIISQKHVISSILSKHKITNQSWVNIEPANIMLVDWKSVEKQIDKKIKNSEKTNLQSYQELMYIKWFIDNKDYLDKQGNKVLFTELNAYAKAEWIVNSVMDWIKWETTEKGMMEKIVWVAKELAIPWIMLGLLLSIFGWTRSIWKWLLLWGIWALVWGKVYWAIAKRVKTYTDDDLGLIIPQEVIHTVENNDDNEYYGKQIDAIQKLNNKNGKDSHKDGKKLPYIAKRTIGTEEVSGNIIIRNISKDILALTDDSDISISAADLFSDIDSGSWYTEDDVKNYLKILKTDWFADNEKDKTLRDYLTDDIDINNRVYENITVFGTLGSWELTPFDDDLNNILSGEYTLTKWKRAKRREFMDARKIINWSFSDMEIITNSSQRKAKIIAALETYDPTKKNILYDVFKKYEAYQDIEQELELKWLTWVLNSMSSFISKYTTGNDAILYNDIETKISDLKVIKNSINPLYIVESPFKEKIIEIEKLITDLENEKLKLTILDAPWRATPLDDFEWVYAHLLLSDINKRLKTLTDFNTSINLDEFHKIKSDLKILEGYKWKLSTVLLTTFTAFSSNPIVKGNQETIITKMWEFDLLKLKIENKIKDKLKPIYLETKNIDTDELKKIDDKVTIGNLERVKTVSDYMNTNKSELLKSDVILAQAKSIFWTGFIVANETSTMTKLETDFEEKKLVLKGKCETYVNSIDVTLVAWMDANNIKKYAEIINKIKWFFPIINIENANTVLFNEYNFKELYKDNIVFREAVTQDLFDINNKLSLSGISAHERGLLNKYKVILENNIRINNGKITALFHKSIYVDISSKVEAKKYLPNSYSIIEYKKII